MSRRDHRPATLHSVFERTFHEERRALTGWVAGLVALAITMLALYPTIRGNTQFSKLFESYPEAFRSMFGVSDYTSGPGYLHAEVFSLMGPLLLSVFSILWGSDLTAGEEQRRTIDVLMANPVSRRRVVLEKWAAMLVGTAVAAASLWLTLLVGDPLVQLHLGVAALSAAVLASWLVATVFGTIALAVGAATGRRGLRAWAGRPRCGGGLPAELPRRGRPLAGAGATRLSLVPHARGRPPGRRLPGATPARPAGHHHYRRRRSRGGVRRTATSGREWVS